MSRSAWIKWARGVEHIHALVEEMRTFRSVDSYEYVCTSNPHDGFDPLIRAHWQLKVKVPYPERWGVIVGDALTNYRAALDHIFWDAVHAHSGPPAKPNQIYFPILSTHEALRRATRDLAPLVSPDVWGLVLKYQPVDEDEPSLSPMATLQWLNNVDKHRRVRVIGRTAYDVGPIEVVSDVPLEIVEQWVRSGPADDGDVVGRVKVRRPVGGREVELRPLFAHIESLQAGDDPDDVRPVEFVFDPIQHWVLATLVEITHALGEQTPDPETLIVDPPGA